MVKRLRNNKSKFFKTKYNALRKAVCLVLDEMGMTFTLRELSMYPEIDYDSGSVRLPKYVEWGYVKERAIIQPKYGPVLSYAITKKGRDFVKKIPLEEQIPYRAAVRKAWFENNSDIKRLFS
jgi:hypothetical protein